MPANAPPPAETPALSEVEAPTVSEHNASPIAEQFVIRHRLATRIWHWINAFAFFIMLMSGLMIFNAHPRLYWGQAGANYDHAWLEIGATETQGVLVIGDLAINTTGFLGLWTDSQGTVQNLAFPGWMTIPSYYSLADARLWHLAFAWVLGGGLLIFMIVSLVNMHFRRDLRIHWRELRPSHIWQDIKDHALLRFPTGVAALHYHILQKLSYVSVIFILLPLVIFTGLTLSPSLNAGLPWLLDIFGGRQSARSIHFIAVFLLFLFFVVHMVMVLLAGPANEIRAIITGRYCVPVPKESDDG